jgi:hypothetical protein
MSWSSSRHDRHVGDLEEDELFVLMRESALLWSLVLMLDAMDTDTALLLFDAAPDLTSPL